jgi:hypothetical protein
LCDGYGAFSVAASEQILTLMAAGALLLSNRGALSAGPGKGGQLPGDQFRVMR